MPWWEDCSFSSWFWSGHCQNAFCSKDVSATFTQKRCNPAVQLFLIAFTSTLDTDLRQDHVSEPSLSLGSYMHFGWKLICSSPKSQVPPSSSYSSSASSSSSHLASWPKEPKAKLDAMDAIGSSHWAKGQSWRIDRAGDLDHPSGTRHRSRGRGPGRSLWCLGRNASQLCTIRKYRNPLRSCSIAAPNPPKSHERIQTTDFYVWNESPMISSTCTLEFLGKLQRLSLQASFNASMTVVTVPR